MANEYEELLKELLQQEEEIQFSSFDNNEEDHELVVTTLRKFLAERAG